MAASRPKDIVVIGGGIAGLSTAYFLSQSPARHGASITVVEGTRIAAGASGFSGGFLARDWHGSATAALSAFSYDLHAKLAADHDGAAKWGYRPVDTLSVDLDATRPSKRQSPVAWLPQGLVHSSSTLGSTKTTAQIHPRLFTTWLADQFTAEKDTSIVIGSASSLSLKDNKVESVTVSAEHGDRVVPADTIVLAAGPWTGDLAIQLLGKTIGARLGVSGSRAHSIVMQTKETLSAHCLFTSITLEDGSQGTPEVYTRPDGTTYICYGDDNEPLPPTAAGVTTDPVKIERLHTQAAAISPVFDRNLAATTIAEQACYLPIANRGRPLLGKVRSVEGVYIASGMSCWGITQGPGSGYVLAQLILEGKAKSADISKLAP